MAAKCDFIVIIDYVFRDRCFIYLFIKMPFCALLAPPAIKDAYLLNRLFIMRVFYSLVLFVVSLRSTRYHPLFSVSVRGTCVRACVRACVHLCMCVHACVRVP